MTKSPYPNPFPEETKMSYYPKGTVMRDRYDPNNEFVVRKEREDVGSHFFPVGKVEYCIEPAVGQKWKGKHLGWYGYHIELLAKHEKTFFVINTTYCDENPDGRDQYNTYPASLIKEYFILEEE